MQCIQRYRTYMKSRLIKEDMMLLMIDLQKLARPVRSLSSKSLDIELRLLRNVKVNL